MDELPSNVIQLDVLRIDHDAKKKCTCYGRGFVIDKQNWEVTCSSCGAKVDPFDALYDLANNHERLNEQMKALLQQRRELRSYKPWLLEVREFESKYRSHKMLPCCPFCRHAFYLKEITSWTSAEYEVRRRAAERSKE